MEFEFAREGGLVLGIFGAFAAGLLLGVAEQLSVFVLGAAYREVIGHYGDFGGETGAARYPVVRGDEAWLQDIDEVLLSSEPYSFNNSHLAAAQALGAIPVPLYQDAVAAEFVFPVQNAEVAFAVVEDQEQVDKMLEVREQCPALARIWFDDPRGLRQYDEPGLASLDALAADGDAWMARHPGFFEAEVAKVAPSDVAAMFFTSGTTGNPKGVVHTHFTLLDRAAAGAKFDKLTDKEEVLAYLPPAWIGQNIFSFSQWLAGRGYAVLTYDYRGVGASRTKRITSSSRLVQMPELSP